MVPVCDARTRRFVGVANIDGYGDDRDRCHPNRRKNRHSNVGCRQGSFEVTAVYEYEFLKLRPHSTGMVVKKRANQKGAPHSRGDKIFGRLSLGLSLLLLSCVHFEAIEKVGVGAEPIVDAVPGESEPTDAMEPSEVFVEPKIDRDAGGKDAVVESDASFPSEDPLPLPASLVKATRVGAKLREARGQQSEDQTETSLGVASENTNGAHDDVSNDSNAPPAGCHWGAMGCNKGTVAGVGQVEMNSSSAETEVEILPQGDESAIKPPPSSLAGSATAKIEAHVMKGRGHALGSPSVWGRDDAEPNSPPSKEIPPITGGRGETPPQGFKLAARIVTSPSDGLSYFLDGLRVDSESSDDDWMMTIPYLYLECGPTIESTTEAFPLMDMVVRHFPASASMNHWINLSGGFTIENSAVGDGDEDSGPKYVEGNGPGHPKLLVALSPIQITVSGNNEETRLFNPGEVVLLEDTLGKGHKMSASPVNHDKDEPHGRDMSVLMVSLPHTVHFPIDNLPDEPYRVDATSDGGEESSSSIATAASSPPSTAEHALFGFAPKHLHQNHRTPRKHASASANMKKPCPFDYDSAYSSLFMPTRRHHNGHRRHKTNMPWRHGDPSKDSSFDETYPPPPGFSTYKRRSLLFDYLPSLRRTMLFGLGVSLTSSFIYCVQLLYPPMLVLWGGGTVVMGGALLGVLAVRWGYRNWLADWEEEWRWKREVKRMKMLGETLSKVVEHDGVEGSDLRSSEGDHNDNDSD